MSIGLWSMAVYEAGIHDGVEHPQRRLLLLCITMFIVALAVPTVCQTLRARAFLPVAFTNLN